MTQDCEIPVGPPSWFHGKAIRLETEMRKAASSDADSYRKILTCYVLARYGQPGNMEPGLDRLHLAARSLLLDAASSRDF